VFNSESCWLVSVDGAEATPTQWQVLEKVLAAKRSRNDRLPIFLFADSIRSRSTQFGRSSLSDAAVERRSQGRSRRDVYSRGQSGPKIPMISLR